MAGTLFSSRDGETTEIGGRERDSSWEGLDGEGGTSGDTLCAILEIGGR